MALHSVVAAFECWFRRVRFDRVVHVNNWMLSTNLYDGWQGEGLPEITSRLIEYSPDRAVAFRSLNPLSNSRLIERLSLNGYLLLPSRQIYIQDASSDDGCRFSRRRDFKNDARLFAETGYRVCRPGLDSEPVPFERMEYLYGRLYLEKYTMLNPQFTSRWLSNGHDDGWLNLFCLESSEGKIDGVAGIVRRGDTMTTPVLGYDTLLPQSRGLYRMLCWVCTDQAIRNRLVLNCSAGAADFKRSRGACPYTECSAVYVNHLEAERKLAWRLLAVLLNRFAAPLLHRYAL